ncbi:MAG: (Fe-S)-binding protein [Methanobrevibacter sp.]|nr:(Fe-S)-binding protein [Methanobrevibacter sp.]
MLYFRGCTTREKLNTISDSTEKILKLAKIDFYSLKNEGCCGSVLLRTGSTEEGKEQMENNLKIFKDKQILVSCAGCYKTLKHDYKEILDVELDVIHISQLLKELLNNQKLSDNQINNNVIQKDEVTYVTFHDSCHLGRHFEIYDAPREVINYFSNIQEMNNIKEDSKCCGSGGGVKSAFPDISKSIATLRAKEAEATGCDILITSCPFCKLNLDENSSLEVLDLTEFVLKRLVKEDINE